MQRYALIIRDKGCVQCGAPHAGCEVHHLMPWNAPDKGETNLDKLALLCGRCHRTLHNNNHTLFQDATGTWNTRPATPNETPPASSERNHPRRE
jgi:5-methylcytosine-specific restriction endonuclease McrA